MLLQYPFKEEKRLRGENTKSIGSNAATFDGVNAEIGEKNGEYY
jgi:hypothetical protein